jgi:hypothetical protein
MKINGIYSMNLHDFIAMICIINRQAWLDLAYFFALILTLEESSKVDMYFI